MNLLLLAEEEDPLSPGDSVKWQLWAFLMRGRGGGGVGGCVGRRQAPGDL